MLGLTLKNLKVSVLTQDGTFSTEIPFQKGLNIIRAENSSGKSTCINAIAYALGLNDILGPGKARPFPRSMYQVLETSKADSTTHNVLSSFVELEVSNSSGKVVKLVRDVQGYDKKIKVVGDDFEEDFFLGSAGDIGSAKSSKGFHYWLEGFVGWELPQVTTHDGKPIKLYFEIIFPLFFIEQKRGWSEIQANTPTYYKVKDAKKTAIQYCLGLEDYSNKNKIVAIKKHLEDIESNWDKIKSTAASMAEFASMRVDFNATLKSDSFFPLVNFSLQNTDKKSSVTSVLSGLESNLEKINSSIKTWPLYQQLSEHLSKQRALIQKRTVLAQREEGLSTSIISNDAKKERIKNELTRYKQLKRLHDVGASLDLPVGTKECPICGSEMLDTLTGEKDKNILSLEQNIDYLKNQFEFYDGIRNKESEELSQLNSEKRICDSLLEDISEKIKSLRGDEEQFLSLYGDNMRERIELEKEINVLKRMVQQQENLNGRAEDIHKEWSSYSSSLDATKKKVGGNISQSIIKNLENKLKQNLQEFGYKSASINYLQISPYTLRPELDGFDIVADSSASDYIRIIWSYTLALLQLASEEKIVKHGGFVVFDEPRQHETDKGSFKSLLEKSSSIKDYGGQVIIATSISIPELKQYNLEDMALMTIFEDDDYILQKEESDQIVNIND